MASDITFVQYVCEQLRTVEGISHRKMFGEYAIYAGDKVVALVCGNQLFVKPTAAGRALLGTPVEAPAYPGAKPSFLIEAELDDAEFMSRLVSATERELPTAKQKSGKKATAKSPKKTRVGKKAK